MKRSRRSDRPRSLHPVTRFCRHISAGALGLAGRRQEALTILDDLERRRSQEYIGGCLLAWVRGCDRINWTKGREFSTLCWMPRRGLSADEKRWLKVLSTLNEAQQRWYVADKALDLGWGGISRLSTVTGLSRTTITKAIAEITGRRRLGAGTRVRQAGGGRNAIKDIDAGLLRELQSILEETTAGDPMSLLKWTTKSTRGLAEALTRRGHPVSGRTVARRLHDLDYSLQSNRKTIEGSDHPQRDARSATSTGR